MSRYYRVVKLSDGSSQYTTSDLIADSTIVAVEVDRELAGSASTESLKYFRSKYSEIDIKVDPYQSYSFSDINYYWIGRKKGDVFVLRDYGILQNGEEANTLEDSFQGGSSFAGANELMLEHGFASSYVTGQYKKNLTTPDPTQPLLTIRRRKSDNTQPFPSIPDNSGAMLTYSIPHSAVETMAVGDSLWLRLSDTASGALTPASVTNSTDDINNTDISTNRYEVRSATNTPLRTFDNRNVFQVAKCVTLADGQDGLVWIDGTVLTQYGYHIKNNVMIRGSLTVEGLQNVFKRYYNATGSTIPAGNAVHLLATVDYMEPCSAINLPASDGFVGFASENIAPATYGLVQIAGEATVTVTGGPLLIGKPVYLSTTYGSVSPTPPTTTGNAYWVAGFATNTNKVMIGIDFRYTVENIYEEPLAIISAAPSSSNEYTGPVSSGATLPLPEDSRDGFTTQKYVVGAGHLQVFLNGQFLDLGIDWAEVGSLGDLSQQIQILQDLVIDDILIIRMELEQNQTLVLSGGGGGGGGTLQDAYAAGRTITTTASNPVVITGTGTVLDVGADINVVGLIL